MHWTAITFPATSPLPQFPVFKFFADSISLMQVFGTIDQAKHLISIMDTVPEPLRCRRTDGRRWRCRLPVLPDQKYCQRHVNRGRLSSRKYVEVLKTFSNSKSKSTATTSGSLLKTTANLQSYAKTELKKASIKNQSMNMKKPSMENSSRPLQFDFSVKSGVQDGNGTDRGKALLLSHSPHLRPYSTTLGVGASSNDHETAQPERCRRTDGRKWRCKKAVLPGMKYCVQHMHRGTKKVKNCQKLNPSLSFLAVAPYQQAGSDGNQPSDPKSSSDQKHVEVLKTFLNSKSKSRSTATTPPVSLLKTTPNLQSHAKTKHNKATIKNQSMDMKKHSMENSSRPLQFDVSVKSVVQDGNGTALGVGASGNDHETAQLERCRRTDGRKWRCKKAVLPGMKYCVQHMHRGAKKVKNGQKLPGMKYCVQHMQRGAKKVKNGQKLNPYLSYLAGAPYQQAGSDGNQPNDASSSSDATTISM